MTRTELDDALNTLGIQVFYNHTTRKDVVNLPFIVYLDTGTNNFMADNITYRKRINYLIILHSDKRDEELEGSIEDLLTENRIPYEINDIRWDDELLMWTTSYTIQLLNV